MRRRKLRKLWEEFEKAHWRVLQTHSLMLVTPRRPLHAYLWFFKFSKPEFLLLKFKDGKSFWFKGEDIYFCDTDDGFKWGEKQILYIKNTALISKGLNFRIYLRMRGAS